MQLGSIDHGWGSAMGPCLHPCGSNRLLTIISVAQVTPLAGGCGVLWFLLGRLNSSERECIMIQLSRRRIAAGLASAGAMLFSARLSADERDDIVRGAKAEGKMALATSVSAANFPQFLDAFTRLYPFIEVKSGYYSAPTGRLLARVDAEIAADALSFDVLHIASVAAFITWFMLRGLHG